MQFGARIQGHDTEKRTIFQRFKIGMCINIAVEPAPHRSETFCHSISYRDYIRIFKVFAQNQTFFLIFRFFFQKKTRKPDAYTFTLVEMFSSNQQFYLHKHR